MNKLLLIVFLLVFCHFDVKSQSSSSFSVETGFFYSYGHYTNSIINIGDYFDQIYLHIGYQRHNPDFIYSFKLGLIEDIFAYEDVGSTDPNSAFFGVGGVSYSGLKTVLIEFQTTVKWFNQKNTILPLVDLGISTMILAQKAGGSGSIGDGQSKSQILGSEEVYKRPINPFIIAGIQYKLFDNPSYSIPIRFGYRIPIFSTYQTVEWTIIDRVRNQTTYESGRKSGFATYFTIGLDFKL